MIFVQFHHLRKLFSFFSFFQLLWSRNHFHILFRSSLLHLLHWPNFSVRSSKIPLETPLVICFSFSLQVRSRGYVKLRTAFLRNTISNWLCFSNYYQYICYFQSNNNLFPCSIGNISNHIRRIDLERIITFFNTSMLKSNQTKQSYKYIFL